MLKTDFFKDSSRFTCLCQGIKESEFSGEKKSVLRASVEHAAAAGAVDGHSRTLQVVGVGVGVVISQVYE